MAVDYCPLCLAESELKESHVLPAFVFKAMKARSATGHIRYSESPNRRVQDGLKKPWLCGPCEGLIGKDETAFATNFFHPWLNGTLQVRYDEWLLRFCVSVSWRVLKHCRGANPHASYTSEQHTLMEHAENRWRQFLLRSVPHPAGFTQQLVIFDVLDKDTIGEFPSNMNRFLLGVVAMDIVGTSTSLMTYAKLGRFILFGIIQPGLDKWEGAKVHVKQGVIQPTKYVLPYALLGFLKDKAREASNTYSSLSEVQLDKIETDAMKDVDRLRNSETWRAMAADADMFGEAAIVRSSKGK